MVDRKLVVQVGVFMFGEPIKFNGLAKNYIQQWSTEPIKNSIGQKWVQDQFKLKKAGIK